jgi:hypothetical protein
MGLNGFFILDDVNIGTGLTTANKGVAIRTPVIRIINSVASGAVVLPDLITNDNAGGLIVVINDSTQTVTIFPFPSASQTVNGGASVTVASNASYVLYSVPKLFRRGGYVGTASGTDWRGATIT